MKTRIPIYPLCGLSLQVTPTSEIKPLTFPRENPGSHPAGRLINLPRRIDIIFSSTPKHAKYMLRHIVRILHLAWRNLKADVIYP